jgi:signal transduction histidine kinase
MPRTLDVWFAIGTGSRRLIRACTLRSDCESAVRCHIAMVDVTDVLRRERELRDRESEYHHVQRLESASALAAGMAHDFNNLLMGMIGFAELALAKLPPEHPAYAHVARSLRAANQGRCLTRQLTDLARARARSPVPIDLDAVIVSTQGLVENLVGAHIVTRLSLDAAGCHVLADEGEIEQILLNLATNARDAMPDGGELAIETRPIEPPDTGTARRAVRLSVCDTGRWMDGETKARIFQPFFTTKAVGKGTGLGLATVRDIVRRRAGHIAVDSSPGAGTRISIDLPMTDAPPLSVCQRAPAPETPGVGNVLLIEDDALVRVTVEHYLRQLGYTVIAVATPAQAEARCLERAPEIHVVISDVFLQGRPGTELCRSLSTRVPGARVLFISAHPRGELTRAAGLLQADQLLEIPFERSDLASALRDLTRPPAGPR